MAIPSFTSMLVGGFVISVVVLMWFAAVDAAPDAALVNGVPGFSGAFPSKHYAG